MEPAALAAAVLQAAWRQLATQPRLPPPLLPRCCAQGVMLSHRALLATIVSVHFFLDAHGVPLGSTDAYLSFLPLAHIFDRQNSTLLCRIGLPASLYSVHHPAAFTQSPSHLHLAYIRIHTRSSLSLQRSCCPTLPVHATWRHPLQLNRLHPATAAVVAALPALPCPRCRVTEELFLHLGGSIGYWGGDIKGLMDDIGVRAGALMWA